MPSDMAVKEPSTRVIGFEGNGDKTVAGQEHDVAAWRVVILWFESAQFEALIRLLEECEVVSVEVDLHTQ